MQIYFTTTKSGTNINYMTKITIFPITKYISCDKDNCLQTKKDLYSNSHLQTSNHVFSFLISLMINLHF